MFKMQMFQLIASNPQAMYYLGVSGGLADFTDLFGDGGMAITDFINKVQSQPVGNIQTLNQLGPEEQANQAYAGMAQEGAGWANSLQANSPFAPSNTRGTGGGSVPYYWRPF